MSELDAYVISSWRSTSWNKSFIFGRETRRRKNLILKREREHTLVEKRKTWIHLFERFFKKRLRLGSEASSLCADAEAPSFPSQASFPTLKSRDWNLAGISWNPNFQTAFLSRSKEPLLFYKYSGKVFPRYFQSLLDAVRLFGIQRLEFNVWMMRHTIGRAMMFDQSV